MLPPQIGTHVHQAVASASGQSLDEGAEEAKKKLPRNRPSAMANFILDQFLPLGLLLAMVVGCACKHHAQRPHICKVGSLMEQERIPPSEGTAAMRIDGNIAARQPYAKKRWVSRVHCS